MIIYRKGKESHSFTSQVNQKEPFLLYSAALKDLLSKCCPMVEKGVHCRQQLVNQSVPYSKALTPNFLCTKHPGFLGQFIILSFEGGKWKRSIFFLNLKMCFHGWKNLLIFKQLFQKFLEYFLGVKQERATHSVLSLCPFVLSSVHLCQHPLPSKIYYTIAGYLGSCRLPRFQLKIYFISLFKCPAASSLAMAILSEALNIQRQEGSLGLGDFSGGQGSSGGIMAMLFSLSVARPGMAV